jgi:hypothetical protein
MRDVDAFADMVVQTVKAALGAALPPIFERLAASDAKVAMLTDQLQKVADLRDRVLAMETKTALPLPDVAPIVTATVGPVVERMAAAEVRIAAVATLEKVAGELRDRLVAIETKTEQAQSAAQAISDVRDRLLAIEAKLANQTTPDLSPLADELGALRERLAVIEVREGMPGPPGPAGKDGRDGKDGVDLITSDLTKDLGALRERIAVAEVKTGVPGPAGRDGQDGLGWDDLTVVQNNERHFTVKAMRGDRVKEIGTITVPTMVFRGLYVEGKSYEPGDTVKWGAGTWHCNKPTTAKPDTVSGNGSDHWTMLVKSGRDGRDGRDAPSLPVVSVEKKD